MNKLQLETPVGEAPRDFEGLSKGRIIKIERSVDLRFAKENK